MHQIQKELLSLSRNINLAEKSLREIGSLIGVDHPQQVRHHMKQLEKKGFIFVDKFAGKVVNVNRRLHRERQFINVPIVGAANCGPAELLAEENIDGFLKLSQSIVGNKELMALKADGDSMNKAKVDGMSINSGDYVLVDFKANDPKHGDYVLAVVDGAANIKRFYDDRENGQVMLVSESTGEYAPIYIHQDDYSDLMINGTVVKVVKEPTF